jgi:hypothetical protein
VREQSVGRECDKREITKKKKAQKDFALSLASQERRRKFPDATQF